MDTRNQSNAGAVSVQLLVILVPVIFGFLGFAIDLGRLYLIRGELNQAANAMALAGARQLIGTTASLDLATNAARLTLSNVNANGNKYNFGGNLIGDSSGFLSSEVPDPSYFATATEATTSDGTGSSGSADGTTAQYAQANITADAPLVFWSLLSLGVGRKTPIAARAVAGISAPLCTACGIEPLAVAPLDSADTVNFGFVAGTHYTLGYQCTGNPVPGVLGGDTQRIPFLILDRYNSGSTFDESQQLFRVGAEGLIPSATQTQACMTVNNTEVIWASATASVCNAASVAGSVTNLLCGLTTRLDGNTPGACSNVTDVATLTTAYVVDSDVTSLDDYTQYAGDVRRVLTIPIVDALSTSAAMTVLGFRQFLLEPTQGQTANVPSDANGRFSVLYIGSPVPLKQGRFDGGCGATSGPGKVVLFQ